MQSVIRALVLLSILAGPSTGSADRMAETGTELLSHCRVFTQLAPMPWGFKVMDTNPSVAACLDFMNDIIGKSAAGRETGTYCLPGEVNPGLLATTFVTFADMYPQHLDQEARTAVKELMGRAYPCITD